MLPLLKITSIFVLATYISVAIAAKNSIFQTNAITGTNALQSMYDRKNGLWKTAGWWQAANCLTTLAEMTRIYPQIGRSTGHVWENTWQQAQRFNLQQARFVPSTTVSQRVNTKFRALRASKTITEVTQPKGFLNGFYDDEGWWALAWTKVYDVTGNRKYLDTAASIFNDMVSTGANATCGGIWWDRVRQHNNAIANELFLSTAAHLANRVAQQDKAYYTNWAKRQWDWFQRSGLINQQGTINDGIDTRSCKNNGEPVWTYNQGVILGALTELSRATNDRSYLDAATRIANAAISRLSNLASDSVLHDPFEPNLGGDGPQFKGVFMRNLQVLQQATGNSQYKSFLERNAQSIWEKARDKKTNLIGNVWSGPVMAPTASSHSSALDALIAAAAVQ